jgi:5-methyltetrahydrofolate--homocysteine methyltransferase
LWNLELPNEVLAVHRAYIAAGSQWVTTNTFGANAGRLANSEWLPNQHEMNSAAVQIAMEAAEGSGAIVAGSVGPTGLGQSTFDDDLAQIYSEQIGHLVEAGVDLIAAETMSVHREVGALCKAAQDHQIAFTCTFSLHGVPDEYLKGHLRSLLDTVLPFQPIAVGINCGEGVVQALQALEVLTSLTNLPKIARPNAGQPVIDNGVARYSLASETFGEWSIAAAQAGASIIGGCCGVSPRHIAAANAALMTKYPD